MIGDESPDLVADLLCVGEEYAAPLAARSEPVKGFIIGMLGR